MKFTNTNTQLETTAANKSWSIFLYSLLILILCACFQFYKYLLQTYPSVITHELMNEFDLTGVGLGNLAATFYYSFLVTQLFVGVLLDKFSTRFITSIAIFTCALGVFLFSYSTTAFEACLSRALIGIGVAFTTVAFMKLASLWFAPKYYPFVSSLVATSTMLGVVFGQMPLAKFIGYLGWRYCLFVIGIAGFVLALLFFLLVRDQPKSPSWRLPECKIQYSFKDALSVIKNKQNWLLMLYAGLVFSPLAVFCGLWGTPFLQEAYHLNKEQSALMVSIAFIGFGIGSPILGILSSSVLNMRLVMISFTLLSCAAICIVLYSSGMPMWLLGTLLFIFGFCLGTYMLVFSAGRAVNPPHLTATVIAMINMGDILTGLAEPAIGKILDLTWDGKIVNGVHYFSVGDYHLALTVLPAFLIISTLLLITVKDSLKEQERVLTMESLSA